VLRLVPGEIRCAWEFRNASWFSDDVYHLLKSRNAALCIADTGESTTPDVITADWGYLRLRDEGYKEGDLQRWADRVKQLGAGWKDGFVFFKHEEQGIGPVLAKQFAELFASP